MTGVAGMAGMAGTPGMPVDGRAGAWDHPLAVDLETDLVGSQLTTLTSSDIRRFERDGYVVVRQAFSGADGLAMERQWWRELEDTRGIRPDDRPSWHQIVGDLKAAKRDPIRARNLTERVRGVLDDLLGEAAWPPPRLGSSPGHLSRTGRLGGADQAMDAETTVDGVPLRVVELTGEPGDMVFCHPVMVHCVSPNRGTRPRFMRIKTQILTHEGRELRDTLQQAHSQPQASRQES
jgi:hypothetical protein